jgi:hypothetical protein
MALPYKTRTMTWTSFFSLALALALFQGCLFDHNGNNGNGSDKTCGTEVNDPVELGGCLVGPEGEVIGGVAVTLHQIPAAARLDVQGSLAKIASKYRLTNADPFLVDSADISGRYSFKGLEAGQYLLQAEAGDLHLLYSVLYDGKHRVEKDSLRPAGSVEGRLFSRTGQDLSGFSCWVLGTNKGMATQSNGVFHFEGLPERAYTIRCSRENLPALQITANIKAETTVTVDPLFVVQTNPDSPLRVSAEYDAFNGQVHVHWSRVASPDGGPSSEMFYTVNRILKGDDNGSQFLPVTVNDTAFRDYLEWSDGDTSKQITYLVRSQAFIKGKAYYSAASSLVLLEVKPPTSHDTQIQLLWIKPPTGDSCEVGDTARAQVIYSNAYRMLTTVLWIANKAQEVRAEIVNTRAGYSILKFACLDTGTTSLQVNIRDQVGRIWSSPSLNLTVFSRSLPLLE